MRWIAFTVGPLSILGGLALCAYSLFGFVVTASTGAMSGGQRTSFDLTLAGGVLAIVAGIALIVYGAVHRRKA
jgi:hypothetical protein